MDKKLSHIHTVGIIFGDGHERHLSTQTADQLKSRLNDRYRIRSIGIDADGNWRTKNGKVTPGAALSMVDLIINAACGIHGEKNRIHPDLERFKQPYSGSSGVTATHSYNKKLTKQIFEQSNIKTPKWHSLKSSDANLYKKTKEVFRSLPFPAVVKPVHGGAGCGVKKVSSHNELVQAVSEAFEYDNTVIIEEYIGGRELSVGLIENFRDENLYVLPPLDITHKNDQFAYSNRNADTFSKLSHRDEQTREKAREITKAGHDALGLRHWSRADVIVSPKRGVYLLEMNAIPHLGEDSFFSHELSHAGIKPEVFANHLVKLADARK